MNIQTPVMFSRSNDRNNSFSFEIEKEYADHYSYLPLVMKKEDIKKAIERKDIKQLVRYSNKAYDLSGRYAKIVNTGANLFNYDYFVTPYRTKKKGSTETITSTFYDILIMLEKFNPKETFKKWGLEVLKDGCYYGYKKDYDINDNLIIQDLPSQYCISVFKLNNKPVVQFDLSYFIDAFRTYSESMRLAIVSSFPKEIQDGYSKLSERKIPLSMINGRSGYWITLDPDRTIKISIEEDDKPYFIQVLMALIANDEANALVKKRYEKTLKSILVSEFPMRKQADLPLVSSTDMIKYNNQINQELQKRTDNDMFSVASLANTKLLQNNTSGNSSEGEKILTSSKADIYDEAGMSQMQFNSDNSVALKYSVQNDEANLSKLKDQFENVLNDIVEQYLERKNKRGLNGVYFKVEILRTTCYNYFEMAEYYKACVQLGYSKVLPMVALGHSQLSVIETPGFENDVLDLVNSFIPPAMSSTMSGMHGGASKENGRPEADNPSEKTQQNRQIAEKGGSN